MTKGKNYNSIVFLTTLSVYLGLVLAGGAGAPQVLAQAALTRNFDVQIEAEIKDDLDKKPDDEEFNNLLKTLQEDYDNIDKYFVEIEDFLIDLGKLNSIDKFDAGDEFVAETVTSMPCFVDGDPVGIGQEKFEVNHNRWLIPALTDARNELNDYTKYLEDCLPSKRFGEAQERNSKVKLSLDSTDLQIEISGHKISPEKAERLAKNFNKIFALKVRENAGQPEIKRICENTRAVSENNQIFIVTRLPRGSIDAPLAVKNAQQ